MTEIKTPTIVYLDFEQYNTLKECGDVSVYDDDGDLIIKIVVKERKKDGY